MESGEHNTFALCYAAFLVEFFAENEFIIAKGGIANVRYVPKDALGCQAKNLIEVWGSCKARHDLVCTIFRGSRWMGLGVLRGSSGLWWTYEVCFAFAEQGRN